MQLKISENRLFKAGQLYDFSSKILCRAGLRPADAALVADTLISAELRGIYSHGMARLPSYISRVEAGLLDPLGQPTVEKEFMATALINANNGFGQIAGCFAMEVAIKKASQFGIGFVAVKNSNHFGITSYYSNMALSKDMIGLVSSNSSPAMNPYGTKTRLLGTNPLSVSIPASKELPIVLDMSTSVVARGKIRYAAHINKPIPFGWAVDREGNPTNDPHQALKGSLEPVGGPKGSGLSLVIDLFCGILTNTALTGEVKELGDLSGPVGAGHTFCAINIASFIDVDLFKNNVDQVIRKIKSQPPVAGDPIYLPGEIEYKFTAQRKEEGIPLDDNVISSLNSVASRYGVADL